MSAPDRRTRLSPEERRRQLIAIGVGLLAHQPLEAVTIERVAAEAGVSRGLVFRYFGSKTGLHEQITVAVRDGLMRATEPRPELPPLDRLRDTITRFVAFAVDHRLTFYSLVRGAASGDHTVREIVDQVRDAQTDRLAAVFGDLGIAPSVRLRIALRAWVALAEQALVDGAVSTALDADELVDLLVGSVRAIVQVAIEPERS
ncbi:TetR/AcrR family transcriptional regulator [Microbacterium sp. NPDC096154]|uniref:TetR/AcrR family transcriptional regulator n=1 Tax=Microbacterium sp. NPDC096154 TaxID=3155549 RepID=UPI00333081FB